MEEIYSQTPTKSRDRPSLTRIGPKAIAKKKFDPYAQLIDLTAALDSPPPPAPRARASGNNKDNAVVLGSDTEEDSDSDTGITTTKPTRPSASTRSIPLTSSSSHNLSTNSSRSRYNSASDVVSMEHMDGHGFGASIAKPTKNKTTTSRFGPSSTPTSSRSNSSKSMSSYIRPSTGAFGSQFSGSSVFDRAGAAGGYRNDGWPSWANENSKAARSSGPIARGDDFTASGESSKRNSDDEDDGEEFDIGAAQFTSKDFETCVGDPEEQMRELLAGAVGDGEDQAAEGDEIVEGFATNITLMPHQVRGVRWMRERETQRRNGGILADDMGLGKTVQTLARIVDGRHTAAEKKVYKAGTLIICPLAVMEQWAEEVRTKTMKGLLKVTTHHGPKRAKTAAELQKYDVVITTFQVLSSEFASKQAPKPKPKASKVILSDSDSDSETDKKKKKKPVTAAASPLFDTKWLRVVIDEAQNIKNHKAKCSLAATDLKAKYRWCLTGTPIQNNVEELYSLFRFLRARPLDNWQTFRERVSSEVKAGRTGVAMKRLQVILKAIMLRRTKNATIDGKPILNLPARTVEVVECEFEGDERSFYDALEQRTALTFNKFLKNGTAMSNYTCMLSMLLRLRQACCHPSLVSSALAEAVEDDANGAADVEDELAGLMGGLGVASERKCNVCFVVLEDQDSDDKCCRECAKITTGKKKSGNAIPTSAKIRKMLELLDTVKERSNNKEKTIIFSQFTSYLNILEPFLKDAGVRYVRYDGSLRPEQRADVLDKIKTDPRTTVILISFKAGSTGLNLTCCNNVILMDLWWNPALEDQAFDRAHRLGQKLDVSIWKLTVAETIEDRILALQNEKRELADAALSGGSIKNAKLTMADIMKLFTRSSDDD